MYTNYARWFCKATSGHDRVWPSGYNESCPECGKEFYLDDAILVDRNDTVHHYDCFRRRKPKFRFQIET